MTSIRILDIYIDGSKTNIPVGRPTCTILQYLINSEHPNMIHIIRNMIDSVLGKMLIL